MSASKSYAPPTAEISGSGYAAVLALGFCVNYGVFLYAHGFLTGQQYFEMKVPPSLVFAQVVAVVVAAIFGLRLWYRAWRSIDDGQARTSAGMAVGLMFVPIFNIYWVFVVVPGSAADYNALLERKSLALPRLPRWLFLVFVVLGLVSSLHSIPYFLVGPVAAIMGLVVVVKTCAAVNALVDSPSVVTTLFGGD